MYRSYISSRMLNTFSYGLNFSQLPKRDNLHIKDKRPAPNSTVYTSSIIYPPVIVCDDKLTLLHDEV